MRRFSTLALLLAVAALAAACGNSTAIRARFRIFSDTISVFALTGSPPTYPAAINTPTAQVVRADGSFSFDIAIDIDAQGRALVYPLRLVATTFGNARSVGVQKLAVPFDTMLLAPTTGYDTTAATVVASGEGFLVRAASDYCALDLNKIVYSKFVVDSVNAATRMVHLRTVVDPNCGFRSFAPGIPPR
jgi:hypothetical protein